MLSKFAIFAATILVGLFISGCYLPRQGIGLLSVYGRARKSEKVLRTTNDEKVREFLSQSAAIKRFAVDSLGLSDDKNYTRYVETDKRYMVDVVTAARADSFEPRKWCWPLVGCVPYKGFFKREDADRLEAKLKRKGYDVHRWRAGAFSSLGILSDPLLSYMKEYSLYRLASMLIHEQTHATLYLRGEAQFNEELATFVGREGALKYIAHTHGDTCEEYKNTRKYLRDYTVFLSFIEDLHAELENLYRSEQPKAEILAEKERIIADSRERFAAEYDDSFETNRFRGFIKADVNNAYLSAHNTYYKDLALYEELYKSNGWDLAQTVSELLKARRHAKDPKEYVRRLVEEKTLASPSLEE